jgi:hypothetical protein
MLVILVCDIVLDWVKKEVRAREVLFESTFACNSFAGVNVNRR